MKREGVLQVSSEGVCFVGYLHSPWALRAAFVELIPSVHGFRLDTMYIVDTILVKFIIEERSQLCCCMLARSFMKLMV